VSAARGGYTSARDAGQPRAAGDGHIETDELSLRRDQGRRVLVSSVSGPPQDVRRWVSRLAARPEIESINEE
jgi:hypothetical protein